jgi:hypothetical protein
MLVKLLRFAGAGARIWVANATTTAVVETTSEVETIHV